jgi:hypothetical protein
MKVLATFLFAVFVSSAAVSSQPAADQGTPEPTVDVDQRQPRGTISAPDLTPASDEKAHRVTFRVRTTLLNGNIDELTPEQIIFFEDTWAQVFNQFFFGSGYDNKHTNRNTDYSLPRLRSFVADEVLNSQRRLDEDDQGALRGRGFISYRWFDIWALMETSCRLCGPERRALRKGTDNNKEVFREMETTLCDALHHGPFACFQDLDECRVFSIDA